MNVHLTPELRRFVDREVSSGLHGSASEVIRKPLRLLGEQRRWREDARRKIAHGLAQAKAGKLVDGHVVAKRLRRWIAAHRKWAS